MTTVEFTDIGGVLRLKADGHANWGGRGHDLVCAAESILAYTLVKNLLDAKDRGWLEELDTDLWDGGVIAEAIPRQDAAAKIGTVFQTILTGYRLLAENYPENVEVIEGEKFFSLL